MAIYQKVPHFQALPQIQLLRVLSDFSVLLSVNLEICLKMLEFFYINFYVNAKYTKSPLKNAFIVIKFHVKCMII